MAREVTDPHGVTWKVRRRVLTASVTPRWRGADGPPSLLARFAAPLIGGDSALGTVGLVLSVLVLPMLFALWFFPVLFLAVEAALFAVLAGGGLLARVVLRRPWRVEASSSDGDRCFWLVPRYADGAALVEAIAAAARTGTPLPAGATAMTRRLPRRAQRR
jgi:hypothetical protein